MERMGKGEFINAISEKSGVSKKEVSAVYESMVEVITEQLANGNKIALVGFGNFEVKHKAARTGVNPSKPSEKIQIPEKDVPKFSFSSSIKEAVK